VEKEDLVFLVLYQKIPRCIVTHEPERVEAEDEGQIAGQKRQREQWIERREGGDDLEYLGWAGARRTYHPKTTTTLTRGRAYRDLHE
jgi:hypothetical protein